MKLKTVLLMATTLGCSAVMSACGGGTSVQSGSNFTHQQLIGEFARRAYGHSNLEVSFVKSENTLKDFALVIDKDFNSFDAYDVSDYRAGEDLAEFLNAHDSQNFYDLDQLEMNRFRDQASGTTFQEAAVPTEESAKMTALKIELSVQKSAKNLKAQFGLSDERSRDLARLAVQISNGLKKPATESDFEGVSKEVLGANLAQVDSALKAASAGNPIELSSVIAHAAQVNGVNAAHIGDVVKSLMSSIEKLGQREESATVAAADAVSVQLSSLQFGDGAAPKLGTAQLIALPKTKKPRVITPRLFLCLNCQTENWTETESATVAVADSAPRSSVQAIEVRQNLRDFVQIQFRALH